MNPIDIVLLSLLIAAVVVETKRGFGKAIFDFAALFVTIRAVPMLAPVAANSVRFSHEALANEAICFAGLFVLVGGILLFLGKLGYDYTLISLETFDPLLGGVLGIGVAAIVGHAIVRSLAISASIGGAPPDVLSSSWIGMEFYGFTSYHRTIQFLSSLAT
ncbi:MAG: CvpA family protein [Armatimonadetes bacterium]|nr:CvpA family protein [Armatimonadota bacterium]